MKEKIMIRNHLFLSILLMVLLSFVMIGCGSTPTPDPSIVWSDDFNDGDMEGWEHLLGEPYVHAGAVYFGDSGGGILYPNAVKTGTWSFDVFICEESRRTPEIWFILAELRADQYANFTINITQQPITLLEITRQDGNEETLIDKVTVREPEKLTGWHHVDITRDDSDNVNIYVDSALISKFNEEFPYDSSGFFYYGSCDGPALDNMIVRNQVIDIQPVE